MKWFAGLLLVVLLFTQLRLWWSDSGVRDVARLRRSVAEARLQNDKLAQRNQQMAEQVRDLKQGTAAIEELARSELGLIAPGETFYQVVSPDQGAAPSAPAAQR